MLNFYRSILEKNDSILDVGCSHGGFLSAITKMKDNINCLGIDIDRSAIETAKNKFPDIAKFEEKNLLEIDIKNKFDLIIFRGTLQYLGDKLHESMEHVHLITKPDSKVIIFFSAINRFLYILPSSRKLAFISS